MGKYILPEAMREEMRKALGKVMEIDDAVESAKAAQGFVSVGDVCSANLIGAEAIPHVSIYDRKTLRRKADDDAVCAIESAYHVSYKVKNPPGTIADDAALAIKLAISAKSDSCILVEGEEDLLALVAILECPDEWVVFYGMPSEGIVAVEISAKVKTNVRKLLKKMERKD